MDYTFTEQEVEMMYYWGQVSNCECGFKEHEQKLYDKLERLLTPLLKRKGRI
jgi:hypothetical protein